MIVLDHSDLLERKAFVLHVFHRRFWVQFCIERLKNVRRALSRPNHDFGNVASNASFQRAQNFRDQLFRMIRARWGITRASKTHSGALCTTANNWSRNFCTASVYENWAGVQFINGVKFEKKPSTSLLCRGLPLGRVRPRCLEHSTIGSGSHETC